MKAMRRTVRPRWTILPSVSFPSVLSATELLPTVHLPTVRLFAAILLAGVTGAPLQAQTSAGSGTDSDATLQDPDRFCRGRITASATGVLSGLVTDSTTAFGLPGLDVRAEWGEELEPGQLRVGGPAQAGYVSDETRPDGRFVLCGIPAEELRLIVSFGDSVLHRRVVPPLDGGVERMDLALDFGSDREPAALFGYVRDAENRGIPGVRVTMTGVRSVLTDGEGFFALDSLRPGAHLLDITHPDSPAQSLPVLVPSGEAGEIALTLGEEPGPQRSVPRPSSLRPDAPPQSTSRRTSQPSASSASASQSSDLEDEDEGVELVLHDPARMRGLRALERRRALGEGYFANRAQLLEEIYYLGELLLVAPGISARRVINGRIPEFVIRRGGRTCSPAVWIDGERYRHPGGLTDFLGRELIAAELHLNDIPTELKTFDGSSSCGVVSAWTIEGKGEAEGPG